MSRPKLVFFDFFSLRPIYTNINRFSIPLPVLGDNAYHLLFSNADRKKFQFSKQTFFYTNTSVLKKMIIGGIFYVCIKEDLWGN